MLGHVVVQRQVVRCIIPEDTPSKDTPSKTRGSSIRLVSQGGGSTRHLQLSARGRRHVELRHVLHECYCQDRRHVLVQRQEARAPETGASLRRMHTTLCRLTPRRVGEHALASTPKQALSACSSCTKTRQTQEGGGRPREDRARALNSWSSRMTRACRCARSSSHMSAGISAVRLATYRDRAWRRRSCAMVGAARLTGYWGAAREPCSSCAATPCSSSS